MKYKDSPKIEEELAKLSWPEAPKIVTREIPGPKSKEILDKEASYETVTEMAPRGMPVAWSEAFGATVKDPDGNMFIDLVAGVATNNVGHSHPKVVEVIRRECAVLMHTGGAPNISRMRLGEKLSQIAPGSLKGNVKMTYGLSGSSAVEIATKFAKKATGRHFIASFEGCYHGAIGLTLDIGTSRVRGMQGIYRPFSPFVWHLGPYAYCYRCPFNLKYPACDLQCAKYIEFQIASPRSGLDAQDLAAIIIEPMQGEGGYINPPDGFLSHIKKVCERFGILFIADEIQVGMGRTGKFFTVEHHGVEPDIITMGKALGGDVPFSAVMMRKDVADKLEPASHILTAVGNATSCAVACTNIDLIQGLLDRALKLGDYIMACFKDMAKEREIIGDIRGKGLGIGVELVKNRQTKKPLQSAEMSRISKACLDRGIFELTAGRYSNVLRIAPPLVITKSHIDRALEIVHGILKEVEGDVLE